MRRLLIGLVLLASPVLAAPVEPAKAPNPGPPPGVWKLAGNGAYEHLASGLTCPQTLAGYRRRSVEVFDRYGLDVGCAYAGPTSGVSYFLTRRDGPTLEAALTEAERELVDGAQARHPQLLSAASAQDGPLPWRVALYGEDGDLRDAVWIADLSGWTLEYRATYPLQDEGRVMGEIKAFAAEALAQAGPRLALCARSASPERPGRLVEDKKTIQSAAMMSSILGGAMRAAATDATVVPAAPSVACMEHAGAFDGVPMTIWREVRADGSDGSADHAVVLTDTGSLSLNVTHNGLETLIDESDNWSATLDNKGGVLIFGYFSGRPPLEEIGRLFAAVVTGKAKAIGGYSAQGKTVSIQMPGK